MSPDDDETLAPVMETVSSVQRHLTRAIAACNELGELCMNTHLAREATEAALEKMRGAFEMAAESQGLWKRRALEAGWKPSPDRVDLTAAACRADIEGSRDKPWVPTGQDGKRPALGEVVGQALGSASMAWTSLDGTGQFDEAWCRKVYDGLMAYLSDWAHEVAAQANEATAQKLAAVHQAWRGSDVEAWLKAHRDGYHSGDGKRTASWYALDALLNDYRYHADGGTSLADPVQVSRL